MSGIRIDQVVPGSIAEELEIEPGDRLLAINGNPVRDIIDYNYFSGDEELTLMVEKQDHEVWELELERDEDESLGLIFAAPEPDECGNSCIFCFVHQLPRGLRRPLYVKDEDYRLSFLYGNYVTLSNIREEDLARIKEQRLSPLYISVHATDPAVREQLLGRREERPILQVMTELADAGITMHTQVVLCPGINDGVILEETVAQMARLYPKVSSLAVVPVGLTRHRRGLPPLTGFSPAEAASFVAIWEPRRLALAQSLGEPFLFLADEFYLKAGVPFPPLETYGDLPQLENGVGMIPLFLEESQEVLESAEPRSPRTVTVVSGHSPALYLEDFLRQLGEKTGVSFRPAPVTNILFGDQVTVTGLVCGRDIIAALQGAELGEMVFVPDVMLKEGEGVFLDDLSVADLEAALQRKVVVFPSTPWGLYEALPE